MMINELTAYTESLAINIPSVHKVIVCPECNAEYRELLHLNTYLRAACNNCDTKLGIVIYDDEMHIVSNKISFACYGVCGVVFTIPLPYHVPILLHCAVCKISFEIVLRKDNTIRYG